MDYIQTEDLIRAIKDLTETQRERNRIEEERNELLLEIARKL